MKTVKKISKKLLLLIVFLSITACQEKAPDPSSIPPQILTLWTAEEAPFFRALGQEFTAATPESPTQIEVIAFENPAQIQEEFIHALAENRGPDLIFTSGNHIQENYPKFLPITGDPTFSHDYFSENFLPIAHQQLLKIHGQDQQKTHYIYGIPFSIETLATIYNTSHIQAHLPEEKDWANTWENLKKNSQILTQKDNSITRFSTSGTALGRMDNILHSTEIVQNIFHQIGVKIFSPDQTLVTIADSIGVSSQGIQQNLAEETINFFKSFSSPQSPSQTWNKQLAKNTLIKNFQPFLEGKLSVIFTNANGLKDLQELHKNYTENGRKIIPLTDIAVTYFPQVSPDESRKILGKISTLAVPISAQNPKKSWDFLKFSSGRDIAQKYADYTKTPPARSDLISEFSSKKDWGIFVRQAPFASAQNYFISQKKLEKLLYETLDQNINQKKSTQNWLQNFSEKLQKMLDSTRTIKQKIQSN